MVFSTTIFSERDLFAERETELRLSFRSSILAILHSQSTWTFVTLFRVLRRKGGKRNPWLLQIHFVNDKAINKYTVNVSS